MDYEAVGKFYVFLGTVLIAVGAFSASLGWYLLGVHKQANESVKKKQKLKTKFIRTRVFFFVKIFLLIAGGLSIVGIGGTLTTRGWNKISFEEQRNNLVQAVVREQAMNIETLTHRPIKGETYFVIVNEEKVWSAFPTLSTNALSAVLSSGFWNYGKQRDRKFLNYISDYEKEIILINRKFQQWNDFLSVIKEPNERVDKTKEYQRHLNEKSSLWGLKNAQNKIWMLIYNEYSWAIKTQLPGAYEFLRQKLQEKSSLGEPNDVSSKKQD